MKSSVQKPDANKELNHLGIGPLNLNLILNEALKNGGDLAELFFEMTESTRTIFEDGKIDKLVSGIDAGVGVRILFDNRSVYGYTTNLTEEGIVSLARTLSNGVESKTRPSLNDRNWMFPKTSGTDIDTYQIKKSPTELSLVQKTELAVRMDHAARKEVQNPRQIMAAVLDTDRKILVVNSDGLLSPTEKTYFQMFCQVVAEKEGRVETGYASEGGFVGLEFLNDMPPETVGRDAAKLVKTLLDAKPAPSGSMPVVISAEAGGTMIHEAVGHGLEADLACNGLSVYQKKIGELVASPLITVVDDGTMVAKRGSFRHDDEGTPSHKTVLIENGILKSYMVDRLSAMQFDMTASGNGRRESFRFKPIVRMTNTYIASGKDDPAEILASTKKGIFVKQMGGGEVDTVTGDFVFAVTEGYIIRDGKLGEAIRGATLVGNGPKVLLSIDRVGTDLGFSTGTCGKDGQGAPVTDAQPTLRIPDMTVGGEVPMSTYWS